MREKTHLAAHEIVRASYHTTKDYFESNLLFDQMFILLQPDIYGDLPILLAHLLHAFYPAKSNVIDYYHLDFSPLE